MSGGSYISPLDLLTDKFLRSAQQLHLPSPPEALSFDGLISTYIGRMVHSFKIPITSIYGVQDFLEAYHHGVGGGMLNNLSEWAKQWEENLADWLDWSKESVRIAEEESNRPQMIPQEKYSRWLTEYGTMDVVSPVLSLKHV